MSTFNGKINLDIRDSTPDWAPYLAPKAAAGAPNVLFIAWDDVGYGTMDVFGGRSRPRICAGSPIEVSGTRISIPRRCVRRPVRRR